MKTEQISNEIQRREWIGSIQKSLSFHSSQSTTSMKSKINQ